MSIECDVLVVGAGPGGSGAAKAAAEKGAKTICIDKKPVIGSPVECGEAVGLSLLKEFKIQVSPAAIYMKHEGTVFWANQKIKIDNCSTVWKSMSVNRHLLDKSFALEAVKSGAKLLVNTELIDAEVDNQIVTSVRVKHRGTEERIIPKIVVAADGVNSRMAELVGRRTFEDMEIGNVAGYEMSNLRLSEPKKIQMFFEEMVGMGYGYIIPLSKNTANVGLGSLGIKKTPWKVFDEFLEEHPIVAPQVKNASIIEIKTGLAPLSNPLPNPVIGNTLFVGDAAVQNLSHVGEGAIPSHICGRIAGTVAGKAVQKKNILQLNQYPKEIANSIGPLFNHCSDIREKIIEIWSSNLPTEKRFLIGSLLVSELISPQNSNLIRDLLQSETSSIVDNVSSLIKKQKLNVNIDISPY